MYPGLTVVFFPRRTKNEAMVALMEKFGFEQVFDIARMHVNGDPGEYKDTVFALTSIECGF